MAASLGWSRPLLGVSAAALLLLTAWWMFERNQTAQLPDLNLKVEPPPADPRLTFDTPFRNVKPDIAYVGDKVCATCHDKIDKSYHHHPMGRSAALSVQASEVERYDATAKNPFTGLERFEFRVEKQPDRVVHHIASKDKNNVTQAEYSFDASLTIGSGTRGRSYLYERDGSVWQSPISWFSEKQIWDVSPGFAVMDHSQRGIVAQCLFCHTNHVEPIRHSLNSYRKPVFQTQSNIGCERCHGPGSLHVAERTDGALLDRIDTSIVNPKHLSPELRESICQQCHLQGETIVVRRGRDPFEFRPGLPLEAFQTVYMRHPNLLDYGKSVGQFEQLSVSKCFTAKRGKMGCTSCHDPHVAPAPAEKIDFYRNKCTSCHQKPEVECKAPASEQQAKANSCIACHMPVASSKNIVHTAVTDHRILRRPATEPAHQTRAIPFGELPLVRFTTSQHAPDQAEQERDLGIALSRMFEKVPAHEREGRGRILREAETRLERALKRWPDDIECLEAMADVLWFSGRAEQALKTCKTVLTLVPDRERSLLRAVDPALRARELDFALECASKAVAISPAAIDHRLLRGRVYLERKDWSNAEADYRAALRENPAFPIPRAMLALCRHHQGDPQEAQVELNRALEMIRDPEQQTSFRNWFREKTRPP